MPSATCEYVNNISYSNSKINNPNAKFYAKKNNLVFENNVPYLLNTGNECLSIQPHGKFLFTSSDCNDSKKTTPVYFNTSTDTIRVGTEGDVCLKYDGLAGPQLQKCNDFDNSQKFIYDHVNKSLRPFNDTTKCMWRDKNGIRGFDDCNTTFPDGSNVTTFENYYIPNKDDDIEYFEQDYTVNMVYYILYMILLIIIFYLVILLSSKK
jgi:hypothetical protein